MKNNNIQQDYTFDNICTIKDFLKEGCKPSQDFKIGVEIEHFLLKNCNQNELQTGDNMSAAYELVVLILNEYLNAADDSFTKHYESGYLTGFYNDAYSISLEPAAQVEISIVPRKCLKEIEDIYIGFQKIIEPILKKHGLIMVTLGYNPYDNANHLELIPKKRYEFMNRYFEHSGKFGKNMMRATASAQVSIDFEDELDCAKKFKLANILSPVISLLTDNALIFDGKPYENHLLRTMIWNSVDNDRCRIAPIDLDSNHIFENYAELIYNLPAIVLVEGEEAVEANGVSVSEYYSGRRIDEDIVKHLISMAFYDVRLKNYVEIRMADSMDLEHVLGYAALIKGIFYNKENLKTLLDYFGDVTAADIDSAKLSLIEHGFEGFIYGKTAQETAEKVIRTSYQGMSPKEMKYCQIWNI